MRPGCRLVATGVVAAIATAWPAAAAPPATKPQHIMSINMCTDLLLLQFVPPSRIASISYIAHDGVQVLFPGADRGVAINHGTAEDIVNQKPDLILAGDFSTPMTRKLARQMGARVVEIPSADDFDGARRAIRLVGEAVGEPQRAEAMVAHMDAELAGLAAHPPIRPARVVAWSGGTAIPGKGTLTDAIITAAGAVNIAARPGAAVSSFGVEELLVERPDLLLYGGADAAKPSLLSDQASHRAVRELYAGRRIGYAEPAYACGLPQSADAARDLRQAMRAAMAKAPRR